MALTEGQQRAFARNILEILRDHEQELKDAGFDPQARTAQLEQLAQDAEDKEAAQTAAREAHLQATSVSQSATKAAYDNASAAVDLISGLLGKNHELVKVIKNLRDEMGTEALRGKKKETE